MKKLFFIVLVTFFCNIISNAQYQKKFLNITVDDNHLANAYLNLPDESRARVDIKCDKNIPLTFETQCDTQEALRLTKTTDGVDTTYTMIFNTDPKIDQYRYRQLTITSPGYEKLFFDLSDLTTGKWLSLSVYDPNATVNTGCYNEHMNKAEEEFKKANYYEALREYQFASECVEANKLEVDKRVAAVDSILLYRYQAEDAEKLLNFKLAYDFYQKIMVLNPDDRVIPTKAAEALANYQSECTLLLKQAEHYFYNHEYDKAKPLYERIIANKCAVEQITANTRLQYISDNERSRQDHSHVITYEWMKDAPFGLHTGSYNMHKIGGFFQINFNSKVFDAIRDECTYEDPKKNPDIEYPEANIAFGWTIKIANPVWIHFGPGFTAKCYYGKYKENNYPGYEKNDEDPLDITKDSDYKKFNIAPAVSPVLGITLKYSYFAIRASYQYRFTFKKPLQNFMGRDRVWLGIGVAF